MSLFFEWVCALSALSVTVHDCVTAVDIFEMKVKQHGNPSYPVKSALALYSRCREAKRRAMHDCPNTGKTFAAAAAGREVFWLHDLFIDRGDIGRCA